MLDLCVGCGPGGSCRLGIRSAERTGASATYLLECPIELQGAPGIAPGWWTAACADEIVGRLPILLGTPAVTSQLSVEFTRPIPVGLALEAVASGSAEEGTWTVEGTIRRADTGQVVARVSGRCREADPWTAGDRAEDVPRP